MQAKQSSTAGNDASVYVTDDTGANIAGPSSSDHCIAVAEHDPQDPKGVVGDTYYVAVAPSNRTTPAVQLDATATLSHR